MKIILEQPENVMQTLVFDKYDMSEFILIEAKIEEALTDSNGIVREMCFHILKAGGKRIRPLLVLYSGLIFSPSINKKLLNAAVASELIHMASLVHDDIVDNSLLRRNKCSTNQKWGNNFAVLCGDYLFAKAFEILSKNRLIKSLDYMVLAIQNMCHGEIEQATNKFDININLDSYYRRIANKTAKFIECCCKSGGVIAGANETQIKNIADFGLNLGLAFQIIDDILDFCGKQVTMGKPVADDLKQGIFTLPIILLKEKEACWEWVKDKIQNVELSNDVIKVIIQMLQDTGVIEESFSYAKSHIEKAKSCLLELPYSNYTDELCRMADNLLVRSN